MAAAAVHFKCSTTTPKTGQEIEVAITALAPDPGVKIIVSGNIQAPGNNLEQLTFDNAGGNVYKAKYVPKVVGRHSLTVNYCGMPCDNSPTMIMVAPHGELKTTIVGGPKFSNPHDIVEVGADLIIANKGSHEVLVTDRSGFLKNKFITPVLSSSQTFEPYALAVHEDKIIVSDLENRRVIKYNKDWVPLKQIGEEHLYRPTGVAVDEDKVFVADDQLCSIRVFDSDGNLMKTIGWEGSKPGELNKPWFMAFNSKRQLVVADCQNCRIQIFNSGTGDLVDCFKVQLNGYDMNVRGLDVDKHDVIYITAITKTIRPFKKTECAMAYTMEGEFLGQFGSDFFYPRNIRIMEENGESVAYIVDGAHHRIMVYKL